MTTVYARIVAIKIFIKNLSYLQIKKYKSGIVQTGQAFGY